MRTLLATLAVAFATIATAATAAPADARQVEPADRDVAHPHVTYTEPTRGDRVFVELNNGAAYVLRPCQYEDSRGCYWNAAEQGNRRGRSFVRVHVAGRGGCTLYVKPNHRWRDTCSHHKH